MRLKTYKMAMSILPKFLTLKWNISRTIWCIEVGDGSFFSIFHALSLELDFFFDRRFPLICQQSNGRYRYQFVGEVMMDILSTKEITM